MNEHSLRLHFSSQRRALGRAAAVATMVAGWVLFGLALGRSWPRLVYRCALLDGGSRVVSINAFSHCLCLASCMQRHRSRAPKGNAGCFHPRVR